MRALWQSWKPIARKIGDAQVADPPEYLVQRFTPLSKAEWTFWRLNRDRNEVRDVLTVFRGYDVCGASSPIMGHDREAA
jgi:hypothetical protein